MTSQAEGCKTGSRAERILQDIDFTSAIDECDIEADVRELSARRIGKVFAGRCADPLHLPRCHPFRRPGEITTFLHFDEDQSIAFTCDKVNFPRPATPTPGSDPAATALVMRGDLCFG